MKWDVGVRAGIGLGLLTWGLAITAPALAAEPVTMEAEVSDVATMPDPTLRRLYLVGSFGNDQAAILDADKGNILGGIGIASLSNVVLAPGQGQLYVAESIWSRGNRGDRQDMVSLYDGKTLELQAEIALPGRVFMVPRRQNFALNASGSKGFVYNMDPSSSVIVVDLTARKVEGVVETPGCALIFPFQDQGFASLCGDGSMATVTWSGGTAKLVKGKPFFDAETDPIFENSPTDPTSGRTLFVSYTGAVHDTRLGPQPSRDKPWSLQAAAGFKPATSDPRELSWRPGGELPMAWHRTSNRLFVLMHAGHHWSQKAPGTEVWIVDLATRTVTKRLPLKDPANSLAITQDEKPLLFAGRRAGPMDVLDIETGDVVRSFDAHGAAPMTPNS